MGTGDSGLDGATSDGHSASAPIPQPLVPSPCISVIIPALNEAAGIGATLASVAQQTGAMEVIVADGGSTDGTPEAVHRAMPEARVITPGRGRARQMNAGAEAASGDVLLFLHADTHLPPGALAAVRSEIGRPGVVGGCFRTRFAGPGAESPWMRAGLRRPRPVRLARGVPRHRRLSSAAAVRGPRPRPRPPPAGPVRLSGRGRGNLRAALREERGARAATPQPRAVERLERGRGPGSAGAALPRPPAVALRVGAARADRTADAAASMATCGALAFPLPES